MRGYYRPTVLKMIGLSHLDDQDNLDGVAMLGGQVERIVRIVAVQIARGLLVPEQRLLSIREMAAAEGVSRDTVQRAYDKLVAGGHVHARQGAGFYVAFPVATVASRRAPAPVDLESYQLIHSQHPLDRSPGSGVLRHEDGAKQEASRVLRKVVLTGHGSSGYGDPEGYLPLREELSNKLRMEGVDAPVESIMTVPGCVAGLCIVVRTLVRPNNMVLVESPSSYVHIMALMSQGADIRRVPREADGPDLDVLRLLCERYRPVMFVLSSVLQNPTGSSMALHKARKLIELAAEFEMILVDDASYADLRPATSGGPVVPLIALGPSDHVIHIGGSSNILSPELGVGHIVAGPKLMRSLRMFRPVHGLGNMLIQERVLYRFLHEGLYRRRCERIRAQLAQGAITLRRSLADAGIAVAPISGGMFMWVDLGKELDSLDVAKRMLAKGYLTAPAKHFCPPDTESSLMRFNVTTTTPSAIQALSGSL